MADRDQTTLTKQEDGSYLAERDGRRVTVPVSQRFGDDTIDRLRAEFEAEEALSEDMALPADHPKLAAWKVAGYARLMQAAPREDRSILAKKLAYWQSVAKASGQIGRR